MSVAEIITRMIQAAGAKNMSEMLKKWDFLTVLVPLGKNAGKCLMGA